MTTEKSTEGVKHYPKGTPYGKCPNCGPVIGEDAIDVEFPHGAKCSGCGGELPKTIMSKEGIEVSL